MLVYQVYLICQDGHVDSEEKAKTSHIGDVKRNWREGRLENPQRITMLSAMDFLTSRPHGHPPTSFNSLYQVREIAMILI